MCVVCVSVFVCVSVCVLCVSVCESVSVCVCVSVSCVSPRNSWGGEEGEERGGCVCCVC